MSYTIGNTYTITTPTTSTVCKLVDIVTYSHSCLPDDYIFEYVSGYDLSKHCPNPPQFALTLALLDRMTVIPMLDLVAEKAYIQTRSWYLNNDSVETVIAACNEVLKDDKRIEQIYAELIPLYKEVGDHEKSISTEKERKEYIENIWKQRQNFIAFLKQFSSTDKIKDVLDF